MNDLDYDMISVVVLTVVFGTLGCYVVILWVEGYSNEVNDIKEMGCDQLFNYLAENIEGGYYLGKTNEIAQKSFDLKCKNYNPIDAEN
ncbi:MAG TPA: hypothetical protein VJJ25_03055 [Nitrosopumilaceae archaeon]|nr:hypothetical protein [Nitrosopumilaceae archaeon]